MCQGAIDFQQVMRATDTDQRRTQGRRDQVEKLLERAEHLAEEDRLLLRQVFDLGLRPVDIAKAARCNRHAIYRRVHQLLRRLADPVYLFVAGSMETLDRSLRPVARAIVLRGMTQRQAARVTGKSIHVIRQQLQTLRILARR